MPVVIKDFNWKQTEDKIVIQVPLHGVHPSKVDIFTSPQYIKASFRSFFFDVVLLHPVDISQTNCIKTQNEVLFDLKKCSEEFWESLEVNLEKQEKNEFKRKLIEEEHNRIREKSEAKVNKKAELKRIAIHEQIELDTKVRSRIEDIRKLEKTRALGDLNEWKKIIEVPNKDETKTKVLDCTKSDQLILNKVEKVKIVESEKPTKNDDTLQKVSRKVQLKSVYKDKTVTPHSVPKPRSTKSLQILFTPREFPTPCRESRLEEENDFLRKQAEARRSAGFVSEDLRPEEKNPQYLLAKGREFLKNNNYLGAISAFSFGIKLSPTFLDLYLARSEAHLAAGNFNRTVEDCSKAIELLKPALPINLDDRALCIGRRGIALFNLGFMKQGIGELEACLKLKKCEEFERALEKYKLEFQDLKDKQKKDKELRGEEIKKEKSKDNKEI